MNSLSRSHWNIRVTTPIGHQCCNYEKIDKSKKAKEEIIVASYSFIENDSEVLRKKRKRIMKNENQTKLIMILLALSFSQVFYILSTV